MGGQEPYTGRLDYNANDLPVTMTLPGGSGVREAMGYDASSRLVTQTLTGPAVVTLGNAHSGAYQDTGDANDMQGSQQDTGDANDMQGSQITTDPQGAQVASLSAYVGAIDPSPANDQYQVAIYADSGGAPGALVASSARATLVANTWNTVPLAATLAPNTSYWLMYNTTASTASYNNLAYDAGGVGSYSPAAQPFGAWPSAFGASISLAYGYSLYATLASGAANPALTLTSNYAYGYNPLNWTTRTTTLSGTDTLAHDARGRLTSESGQQVVATGGAYKWTYDNNGNLLSQIGDDGYPVTYTYTQAITPNQLQTMVMGDGQPTASYAYDVHGDTTAITDGTLLNTHLTYDSQARPTQITTLDHRTPLTVTLSYNPSGQRASYHVVEPGQPTLDQQFTYRDGVLGQVRLTSGTTAYTDTYLYTDAGAPYELLRTTGSGATSRYWYEVDGRGNVVALTDSTGKVVDRYAYDSWGELTSNDATDETVPQQLRYAGYWYDEKLSWYWLSVRYYDPEIERFLQPDPSEQDGVRTYAYVDDNPLDASDATGLAGTVRILYGQPNAGRPTGLDAFITGGAPPYGPNGVPSTILPYLNGLGGVLNKCHLLGRSLGGPKDNPLNFVPCFRRVNSPIMYYGYEAIVRERVQDDPSHHFIYTVEADYGPFLTPSAPYAPNIVRQLPSSLLLLLIDQDLVPDPNAIIFNVRILNTPSATLIDLKG